MSEGYLLCASGADNYMQMANRLIKNIRVYDTTRAIVILTNDVERCATFICDVSANISVIQFHLERHIHPFMDASNAWNRFGLYPKLYQSFYSPFDTTMFIDADMQFHKDFTFMWDHYSKNPLPISIPGLSDASNRSPPSWHWNRISQVMHFSGLNIPQTSSTLILYRRAFQEIVTRDLDRIFENREIWHLEKRWRGSWPDEIFYSILIGIHHIIPNEPLHKWIFDEKNVLPADKL